MTNFQKVKTFMEMFGQEVKSKASFGSNKINQLRYNLIKEELDELREAIDKELEMLSESILINVLKKYKILI